MSLGAALPLSLALAAGVTLAVSGAVRARRPRLAARLDPWLRGLQPVRSRLLASDELPLTGFPNLERLLRPFVQEAARLVERWLGGGASVARRLREAGRDDSVARFRAEQVLWGLLGFVLGLSVGFLVPGLLGQGVSALFVLALVGAGALGGVLGRDWWLGREVQRRQARMLLEFPTLADLLCLAVTAGESPRAALERAVSRSHGEMSRELALVLANMRGGTPLTAAMEELAARVPLPQVARFVDGLVVAVERGTPLADVLRAQAGDVREQHKRQLIESGGQKEIFMLVPVVFLILPVVVLFALYPGFFSLSVLAP
jgi:tight adherence protein C